MYAITGIYAITGHEQMSKESQGRVGAHERANEKQVRMNDKTPPALSTAALL